MIEHTAPYSDPVTPESTIPNEVVVPSDILVTPEETTKRLNVCTLCDELTHDVIPKCSQCNCSISMLTTLLFKTCPIGKW